MTLWIIRVNIEDTSFTRVQGTVVNVMPAILSYDKQAVLYVQYLDNNNRTRTWLLHKDREECTRWHCDYSDGDVLELPLCRIVTNKRETVEDFDCPAVKAVYFAWWSIMILGAGSFLVAGWQGYHS